MFLRKLFRFIPRSTLRRALSRFNRGEFQLSIELFEDILQQNPDPGEDVKMYTCEAYVEVGSAMARQSDLSGAVRALERAAELRPGYADVQLRLGKLYEQTDQPQSARQAYERALAINPRYFEARLSLARLLMQLEESNEALYNLEEATRLGPESASSDLHELMQSVPQTGPTNDSTRDRLEQLFEKLLSSAPSPVLTGIEVAREALREGKNQVAIVEIKKLLQRYADFPDLHNLLGVAYDNEEMADDAIEEFERALQLNPKYLDARLNLGLTLFGRGRFEEAERHLRQVEKKQPDHKLTRSVLSQIKTRDGVR